MPDERNTALWFADDRAFLVPDDVELPDGSLEIIDLSGEERSVDEDAVLPFEIDSEEVPAHLSRALKDTLHQADQVLAGLATLFRQTATGRAPDDLPGGLMDALSEADAVKEALEGLMQTAAIAASGDYRKLEELKANARRLAKRWEGKGADALTKALLQFPDELVVEMAQRREPIEDDA